MSSLESVGIRPGAAHYLLQAHRRYKPVVAISYHFYPLHILSFYTSPAPAFAPLVILISPIDLYTTFAVRLRPVANLPHSLALDFRRSLLLPGPISDIIATWFDPSAHPASNLQSSYSSGQWGN